MSIKGKFVYLFISIIISISFIYTKSIILLCIYFLYLFFILKKFNFKFVLINLVFFLFFNLYKINSPPMVNQTMVNDIYKVKQIKEKHMIVSDDNINYLVYIDEIDNFNKKDEIKIYGEISYIENDLELDTFEFKKYLNNQRVFYQINMYDYQIISQNNSLSSKIKSFLVSKLENESYKMTNMLIFNDKYADIDSYNNLLEINAVHLFVVSGFHISFFNTLISKCFKRKSKVGIIISLLVCSFYVFLLDFSISATRALISLFINKLFKKHLNSLDALSIAGIILLFVEPLNIFSYSFIMSFLMTFIIIISSFFLKKKNKIIQTLYISLICFLAIIPIQLLINYKVNFLSLFTNMILSYVVIIIFVLCLLGMIISLINGNLFSFIYKGFNDLIEKLTSLNTSIVFGSLKPWMVVIYYLIFLLFLHALEKNKNKIKIISVSLLVLCFITLYNRHYFNFNQKVTFLNVYQGDCCIIQDSFNDKVIMIDTGGLINYDIASKKIMPYLNYHGIRKIDILVLTHNDYDHMGASKELQKQIKINNIIDNNDIEKVSSGKITLYNLNTYDSSDDNDSSITLYGKIGDLNFLFTGDISKEIENKIIKDNPLLSVDVLKVAHHGSNTSTSDEFIKTINPNFAIISVGKNNHYGHPNKEVLETLNNYNVIVYRTDINGTIRFIIKKDNNYFVELAK